MKESLQNENEVTLKKYLRKLNGDSNSSVRNFLERIDRQFPDGEIVIPPGIQEIIDKALFTDSPLTHEEKVTIFNCLSFSRGMKSTHCSAYLENHEYELKQGCRIYQSKRLRRRRQ